MKGQTCRVLKQSRRIKIAFLGKMGVTNPNLWITKRYILIIGLILDLELLKGHTLKIAKYTCKNEFLGKMRAANPNFWLIKRYNVIISLILDLEFLKGQTLKIVRYTCKNEFLGKMGVTNPNVVLFSFSTLFSIL